MDNFHKYKPTDKMSNVISENYSLISVMSRFGLPLGFGEKTVAEVCNEQGVDCNTFLIVVNFVNENGFSGILKSTLSDAQNQLHPKHNTKPENVLVCIQNLFYELLHSNNFEDSILKTSIRGGDTSKNCALVGSLFGALYGIGNIPIYFRDKVLSSRSIKGLPKITYPRSQIFWPVDILIIAENLLKC